MLIQLKFTNADLTQTVACKNLKLLIYDFFVILKTLFKNTSGEITKVPAEMAMLVHFAQAAIYLAQKNIL